MAPPPDPQPPDPLYKLRDHLSHEYNLALPPAYAVVVEGWTDFDYLHLAAGIALRDTGEDLLSIPDPGLSRGQSRIEILVPTHSKAPRRGGTTRMTDFGDQIKTLFFSMELLLGLVFVFDHDKAGQDGGKQLEKYGYKQNLHFVTLTPTIHKRSCGKTDVAIEDLLSLRIQNEFFASGSATCTADFSDGRLVRYKWEDKSKQPLRDHVKQNATWEDIREVARVLARVRQCWGFPVDLSPYQ